MYIRRTTRKRKDGSRVGYLQLARKVRDPLTGIPKDEILYHFGREDELDHRQVRRLIQSFCRFLPVEEQVELSIQMASVSVDEDMRLLESSPHGPIFVLEAIWSALGVPSLLAEVLGASALSSGLERHLFALVASRVISTDATLSLERWVEERAHIEGLAQIDVHSLYQVMDLLVAHQEALQETLFFSCAKRLGIEPEAIFFEVTAAGFEVEGQGSPQGGREPLDLPQNMLGLAITCEGLPVRCWVMKGHVHDASCVEQIQSDLARWRLDHPVWVVDRESIDAEKHLALQQRGGQVLFGEKMRSANARCRLALSRAGRFKAVSDDLEIRQIEVVEGGETQHFVLVRNLKEVELRRRTRDTLIERLKAEIEVVNEGVVSKTPGHGNAVRRLLAHKRYRRYLRQLRSGQLRVNLVALQEESRYEGKFLLSTTDVSLSADDVTLGYSRLLETKQTFRALKPMLESHSVYHDFDERARAQVLLNWIALLLVRFVEIKTGDTWERVQSQLSSLTRCKLVNDQKTVTLLTAPTYEQGELLSLLEVKFPDTLSKVSAAYAGS